MDPYRLPGAAYPRPMDVPTEITCVECGGRAHRVSFEPPDGWDPGAAITFACEDCDHRLDVVFAESDDS